MLLIIEILNNCPSFPNKYVKYNFSIINSFEVNECFIISSREKKIEGRGWLCVEGLNARESAEERMVCAYHSTEDKCCFTLHLRLTTSILDACQNYFITFVSERRFR